MRAYTITWHTGTFTMPAITTSNGWNMIPTGFEDEVRRWDPDLKGKKSFGRSWEGDAHAKKWREARLFNALQQHPGQLPNVIDDSVGTIANPNGVTVLFDHPRWGTGSLQLVANRTYRHDEDAPKGKSRFAYKLGVSPICYAFTHQDEARMVKQIEGGTVWKTVNVYYTLEEARQAVTDFMANPIKATIEGTRSWAKNQASNEGDQEDSKRIKYALDQIEDGIDWDNVEWPDKVTNYYAYSVTIPPNGTAAFVDDTLITYSNNHRKPFLLKTIPHWRELGSAFTAAKADGVTVNYSTRVNAFGQEEITDISFIFDVGDGVNHTITIDEEGVAVECGWQTEEQKLIAQHKHQIKQSGIDSLLFGESK